MTFRTTLPAITEPGTGFHLALRRKRVVPILVGFATYNTIYPAYQEPVELRTVHPAPPATTKVHGKTYPLESTNNPFRVDEQDNYKDSFPFLDADKKSIMAATLVHRDQCFVGHDG